MVRAEVAVVGGGIAGLCTAFSLTRRGMNVILLERRTIGGGHGGSGSTSRIIRSTYGDPMYVRLMQEIIQQHWPALEAFVGEQLIIPTPGLFFGRGSRWQNYVSAVDQHGIPVERLPRESALEQFPWFRLETAESILLDRSAGVIAASRALRALAKALRTKNVTVWEDTELLRLEALPDRIVLETNRERIEADRVVLAMGGWIGRHLPVLKREVFPLQQTVGYFDWPGAETERQPPRFPVWCWIGESTNDFFYGLPEWERRGVKIGWHRTEGIAENPDQPGPENRDAIHRFIEKFWNGPLNLVDFESCWYAMTDDEDFVLGRLPGDERMIVVSTCSGHGFKFGPWVGEIAADLARTGDCSSVLYDSMRTRWTRRLARRQESLS